MKNLSVWLFIALFLALMSGCKNDGLIGVSGQVICDGKPLESGAIHFTLVDQADQIFSSKIIDGKYDLRAREGKMIVRIYGTRSEVHPNPPPRPAFQKSDGPVMREVLFLPPKYNMESTLTAEVSSSNRKFDFTVEDDGSVAPSLYDVGPQR